MIFQPYTSIPSSAAAGRHNQRQAGHRPVGQHLHSSTTAGSGTAATQHQLLRAAILQVVAKQPLQRQQRGQQRRHTDPARYAPAAAAAARRLTGTGDDHQEEPQQTGDVRAVAERHAQLETEDTPHHSPVPPAGQRQAADGIRGPGGGWWSN